MNSKQSKGFTLIELLVVVAIIALLMSVLLPALGKAKEYAQRVVCRNQIRQQCLGVQLYSNDNDSYVPQNTVTAWLWDLSFFASEQMSKYAGFENSEVFFCPANRMKKATDARFWQYSWLVSGDHPAGSPPFPQPVTIADESVLSTARKRREYRVLPYIYMFQSEGSGARGDLLTGERAEYVWLQKMANVRSSGSREMIMDAVISENNQKFVELTAGGIDELSGGTLTDNTNHMSRHKIGTTNNLAPSGGNVGFADGHVEWRDFDEMKHRYNSAGAGATMWWWW